MTPPPNFQKASKASALEYDFNSTRSNSSEQLSDDSSILNQTNTKIIQPSNLLPLQMSPLIDFPEYLKNLFLVNGEQGKLLLRYPQDFDSIELSQEKQTSIHNLILYQRLNKITRKFPPNEIFQFISLQFKQLSWELIIWCLKSILNDRMTSSEKLLHSRLKEVFAMKIPQPEWQQIMKGIIEIAKQNNWCIPLSKESNNKLPDLYIQNFIDPVNNNSTILIKLDPLKYNNYQYGIVEDYCVLGNEDQKLWEDFRMFVDEFFGINKKKWGWTSSMEISGQQQLQYYTKKKKSNQNNIKYDGPAIPGGKYGFALFLQLCGKTETLKNSSLGKLSMIVQEAIKRKIIVYYKTLLVKSSENIFEWQWNLNYKIQELSDFENFYLTVKDNQALQQKFFWTLNLTKEVIIEQQKQEIHKEGVPLAKIPKLLLQKGVLLNQMEFGITKLKNFIEFIEDIIIDNPASTSASARFQEKNIKAVEQNIPQPNKHERIIMKIKKELKNQPVIDIQTLFSKIPQKMNMDIIEFETFLEKYQKSLQIEFDYKLETEQIIIQSMKHKQKLSEDFQKDIQNTDNYLKNSENKQPQQKFAYFLDPNQEDGFANIDWNLPSSPNNNLIKSKSDPWSLLNNTKLDNTHMQLFCK